MTYFDGISKVSTVCSLVGEKGEGYSGFEEHLPVTCESHMRGRVGFGRSSDE